MCISFKILSSPTADAYEESLSTLKYVERAKLIQQTAVVNEDVSVTLVKQLRSEISQLKQRLSGKLGSDVILLKTSEMRVIKQVRYISYIVEVYIHTYIASNNYTS